MKKLMGEQLNPRDIDEIIQDVDLNGDGQVDFEGQKKMIFKIDILYITDSRTALLQQSKHHCEQNLFKKKKKNTSNA